MVDVEAYASDKTLALDANLGLQQHQTEIANDLSTNPTSVFTLQNAGSPVSSTSVEDLVVNGLYGGEAGIQQHIKEGEVKDVFRSQVNPGDPIGALGGNFGGVNNNAPVYTSEYWSQVGYTGTRGVPTLFDSSTSPHSGYGCVIGCGENGTAGAVEEIYAPETNSFRPLTEFYKEINVDSSKSNINSAPTDNTEPSTQIGIGVNQ